MFVWMGALFSFDINRILNRLLRVTQAKKKKKKKHLVRRSLNSLVEGNTGLWHLPHDKKKK
jgi:hypothetical protein